MPINVFDLAGYTPNLFGYEPVDISYSTDTIFSEEFENDWDIPIFHAKPEVPQPWVEYYRQSAIYGDFLTIDDAIFKDHWKEYHSWVDEWNCCCKAEDKTEWCYCKDDKSSAKCSQWLILPVLRWCDYTIY